MGIYQDNPNRSKCHCQWRIRASPVLAACCTLKIRRSPTASPLGCFLGCITFSVWGLGHLASLFRGSPIFCFLANSNRLVVKSLDPFAFGVTSGREQQECRQMDWICSRCYDTIFILWEIFNSVFYSDTETGFTKEVQCGTMLLMTLYGWDGKYLEWSPASSNVIIRYY